MAVVRGSKETFGDWPAVFGKGGERISLVSFEWIVVLKPQRGSFCYHHTWKAWSLYGVSGLRWQWFL